MPTPEETQTSTPPKLPLTWAAIARGGEKCSFKGLREMARLIDGIKASGSKQELIDRLRAWAAEDADRFRRYFGEVRLEDGSPAVVEELREVDTAPLERLQEIRGERELYAGRLEQLAEKAGDHSAAVVDRVRQDYEARIEALDEQARAPSDAARREYAKLRSHLDRFQKEHREAVLEKEELTLRHEVGELRKVEFRSRVRECEGRLEEREIRLAHAQRMRQLFLEAVGSQEQLEGSVGAAPETEEEPNADERETVAAADHPVAATTVTIVAKRAAAKFEEPAPDAGATMIFRRACLVNRQEDGSTEEYRLGLMETVIGRSVKADIRVVEATVSRRHARLTHGTEGFVIADLGSENGTLVNGERIEERVLADGDLIRIGPAEFEFRQS